MHIYDDYFLKNDLAKFLGKIDTAKINKTKGEKRKKRKNIESITMRSFPFSAPLSPFTPTHAFYGLKLELAAKAARTISSVETDGSCAIDPCGMTKGGSEDDEGAGAGAAGAEDT